GNDALEIVDVVQVAAVELVDRGIEVARHGDVDEEQWTTLAPGQRPFYVFAREDEIRCARRRDHDVDTREVGDRVLERCGPAAKADGELLCLVERAIRD